MGKKDVGFLGGFLAAAALGLNGAGRRVKVCEICHKAIGPGDGYRTTKTGHAHGACAKQQEAQRSGTDASQGQADGSGDSG